MKYQNAELTEMCQFGVRPRLGSKKKFTTMDVYHAVRGMELLYAHAKNVPNNSMVIILYA